MDDFNFTYHDKFKLIILLTLFDLITTKYSTDFVQNFKYSLFTKTNTELNKLVMQTLNKIAENYKHIAPYKY